MTKRLETHPPVSVVISYQSLDKAELTDVAPQVEHHEPTPFGTIGLCLVTRILATNCCHPNLLLLQPKNSEKGAGTPDGIRTRDLRRERAMS